MELEFDRDYGAGIPRRRYVGDGGRLVVETSIAEYDRDDRKSIMHRWVEEGWLPAFVDRVVTATTYYNGGGDKRYIDAFNHTCRPRPGWAGEAVFEWMLEATPENERLILDEIERLYDAAGGEFDPDRLDGSRAVKVAFPHERLEFGRGEGELMYVLVSDSDYERILREGSSGELFEGILFNDSCDRPALKHGSPVRFVTRGGNVPVALPD